MCLKLPRHITANITANEGKAIEGRKTEVEVQKTEVEVQKTEVRKSSHYNKQT